MYPQQMQPIRRTASYAAAAVTGPTYDRAAESPGYFAYSYGLGDGPAAPPPPMTPSRWPSGYQVIKRDAALARKLGQLQPVLAVCPPERAGQRASPGPTQPLSPVFARRTTPCSSTSA